MKLVDILTEVVFRAIAKCSFHLFGCLAIIIIIWQRQGEQKDERLPAVVNQSTQYWKPCLQISNIEFIRFPATFMLLYLQDMAEGYLDLLDHLVLLGLQEEMVVIKMFPFWHAHVKIHIWHSICLCVAFSWFFFIYIYMRFLVCILKVCAV